MPNDFFSSNTIATIQVSTPPRKISHLKGETSPVFVLRGIGLLDGKLREIGSESAERLESKAKEREIFESLNTLGA